MDTLLQDLRFAVRTLLKRPAYTLVAVVTLMLGIGATTAIFSVVSAVLLRPLPYPTPDRLVALWGSRGAERQILVSVPDLEDWRTRNHTLDDLGIVRSQSVNLTGTDAPDRLIGAFVTASTLQILGARTSTGRVFTPEEASVASGQPVAVLSHATWKTRFGSDPQIVGRTLTLNGRPHQVIGVTVPEFQDAFGGIEVWLPITSAPSQAWFLRSNPNVWGIGRMKPGVSLEQAQSDLSTIAARLAAEYPESNAGSDASVVGLQDDVVGNLRPILLMVLAFVGVVLLIACANVANLQLARAASRRREMSLRAALGAGRARLMRQLLTESLVLSLLGGAAGILLAQWATAALVAAAPGGLPAFGEIGLDRRVLFFSAAITMLAGLLFGAAPAFHAARTDLNDALKLRSADEPTQGNPRVRHAFVAMELALCIVLLVGAGLLTRSLLALQRVNPGFDPRNLLTAEFRLPSNKYPTDEQTTDFMARAITQIRAVPGVRSAALVRSLPLSGNWGRTPYAPDTRAELTAASAPMTQHNTVSIGFFRAMDIPLLEGRDFDERDRAGSLPVAIVNRTLAGEVWPGQSPLGHRLKLLGPPEEWVTVIGVAGDVKQQTLGEPAAAQVYQPFAQAPGIFNTVVARTDGDPDRYAPQLRAAIWSVDRDQPVWKVRSMEFLVGRDVSGPRFTTALTLAFALLALILAAVGVYGVMSYAVVQRTREVGIRMALGAQHGEVIRLVLGRGMRVVAVATAVGTAAAFAGARLIESQLFGVTARDPVTFVAVPLMLMGVALVACYLPARRAARVDPMIALRSE